MQRSPRDERMLVENLVAGRTDEVGPALALLRRERVERPTVYVGMGTCGLGAGAAATKAAVHTWFGANGVDGDVVEVGCVGLCAEAPLIAVQLPGRTRLVLGNATGDVVAGLLSTVVGDGTVDAGRAIGQDRAAEDEPARSWPNVPYLDEHPFFAPQTRWVLPNCGVIDPSSMAEYAAHGGYRALRRALFEMDPDEVCRTVFDSGLRGRGGGGFPTGRKWQFARASENVHRYLVCNADEGDPGAFMDRAVIEGDPHRLLEGMAIAAYAIGAHKAYIYIRAEYPLAIARLRQAMAAARELGFLGDGIMGSPFGLDMVIKEGAGAFVCGEETALMASIEGRRGMPRPRPPFPAAQGLFGSPTIINNVETLANVPAIIARGARWFRSVGTESSKGTKVFALSGDVTRTGLVEVAMGTSIREIVFAIGGGVPGGKGFKAVQIGGPSGGCIPSSHLDTAIDYESLTAVGAMMGSGGLVVMDETTCMVDLAAFFMDFIQRESCGKCIPCREGTRRLLEILESIKRPRGAERGVQALERFKGILALDGLAAVIKDTSLCGLGQTAPNPVLSTLRWFRDEYEAHVFDRRCPAGACRALLNWHIDVDRCTGCGLCRKKCPAGAIMGAPKSPHYIVLDKCVGCGTCADVCRVDAVRADRWEDASA